jgi:hypothetical protein
MTVLKAHFDGKVLVPDEPVSLPVNCALEVHVRPARSVQSQPQKEVDESRPFAGIAELLSEQFPVNPDWPEDGAAQHDHYLYGTPKRP